MKFTIGFVGLVLLWMTVVSIPRIVVAVEPRVIVDLRRDWDTVLDSGGVPDSDTVAGPQTLSFYFQGRLIRFDIEKSELVDSRTVTNSVWHSRVGYISYAPGAERMVLQSWDNRPLASFDPSTRQELTDGGVVRFSSNGRDVTGYGASGDIAFRHNPPSPITAFSSATVGESAMVAIGHLDGTVTTYHQGHKAVIALPEDRSDIETIPLVYGIGIDGDGSLLAVYGRSPTRACTIAPGAEDSEAAKCVDLPGEIAPDAPVQVIAAGNDQWAVGAGKYQMLFEPADRDGGDPATRGVWFAGADRPLVSVVHVGSNGWVALRGSENSYRLVWARDGMSQVVGVYGLGGIRALRASDGTILGATQSALIALSLEKS